MNINFKIKSIQTNLNLANGLGQIKDRRLLILLGLDEHRERYLHLFLFRSPNYSPPQLILRLNSPPLLLHFLIRLHLSLRRNIIAGKWSLPQRIRHRRDRRRVLDVPNVFAGPGPPRFQGLRRVRLLARRDWRRLAEGARFRRGIFGFGRIGNGLDWEGLERCRWRGLLWSRVCV